MPTVKVSYKHRFRLLKVDGLSVAAIDALIKKTKVELKQKVENENPDHD